MALENLRMTAFPPFFTGQTANAVALTASNVANGGVFTARDTVTVTRLGFAMQIKAGTPPTYRISLQSVGADGLPSGTILGATGNGFKTFSPSGYSNYSFNWLTLDETVSITAGEKYAIVVDYSSGTINGSNYMNTFYGTSHWGGSTVADGLEYALLKNPSWSKVSNNKPPLAYGTSGDCWGYPISDSGTQRSTPSGTISGVKFSLPSPFGSGGTFKLRGVSYFGAFTAGKTLTLRLYEGGGASDTTVLDSVAMDTDHFADATSSVYRTQVFDGAPPTLNFGSTYRLAWENSDAASTTFWTVPVSAAADVAAIRLGSTYCFSTRGAGNWTDTTTAMPVIYEFLLEDVQAPAAGGGSIIVPSLQGITGLRSY